MATPTTENRKGNGEKGERKEVPVRTGEGPMERARNWLGFPRAHRAAAMTPYDFWSANPLDLLRRVTEDLDRMYADFGFRGRGEEPWAPDIEVFERGDELIVRADLPGVKREDLRIQAIGSNVVVEGERRHEVERKEGDFYRTERSYGSFRRVIPLPEAVKAEEAKATFDDGVLEIKMKNLQPRGRRIEIGSSRSQ